MPNAPRLRQAVLAARDLDQVVSALRELLQLGEPFHDPGVAMFGLRNAVFAIGDTFLEVISPVEPDTSAGRLLDRRGGDCGYMLMFEVDDLPAARRRVAEHGIREVWEVELDDIAEVHLHPADMQGAIVALSAPQPPGSWRWGGPGWTDRSVPGEIRAVTFGVPDPTATASLWEAVIGPIAAVRFVADADGRGPVAIALEASADARLPSDVGGVRLERV